MGHSRTPTQNTAGDGFPADPIDGYMRASIRRPQSYTPSNRAAATGQAEHAPPLVGRSDWQRRQGGSQQEGTGSTAGVIIGRAPSR